MLYLVLETVIVLGAIGAAIWYQRKAKQQQDRADFWYHKYVDTLREQGVEQV